ncbi:MAG TPA: hypothetical protein VKY92_25710 [Verrucomicrobiae bacterium]|nr:hypothetical protein [Verrucomicrobiae bacterium]
MKSKRSQVAELEAELFRLNAMLRRRRAQIAQLEACPNKDCECRKVWKEVVDQKLADQVGKVRKKVRARPRKKPAARRGPV